MSKKDNLHNADGKPDLDSKENPAKKIESESPELQIEETKTPMTAEDVTAVEKENTIEDDNAVDEIEDDNAVDEIEDDNAVDEIEDDNAVDEIEASNAEDAEDEGNQERHTIEIKDYHAMSMEELVDELTNLINKEKVQAIRTHVDSIKKEFNEKFSQFLEEKKDDFISEGGNPIDFHYSSPIKSRFNSANKEYKNKLKSHYKKIESHLKKIWRKNFKLSRNSKA